MKLGQVVFCISHFQHFLCLSPFIKAAISASGWARLKAVGIIPLLYWFIAITFMRSTVGSTQLNYTTLLSLGLDIIQKVVIQRQCRSGGFDSGSRTIVSLIPDVLKPVQLQQKSGVITAQNFMLLVIQIRISSKPTWLHSRPLLLHPWCKMHFALFSSTLMKWNNTSDFFVMTLILTLLPSTLYCESLSPATLDLDTRIIIIIIISEFCT